MKKKLVTLMLAGAMVIASFAGCGSSSDNASKNTDTKEESADKKDETAAADTKEDAGEEKVDADVKEDASTGDAGFTENEIFSDQKLDFLNLSAVWFQAVPMENETMNYSADDADIHIEADISALENDLGYGVGDWVPYLTVDYLIEDKDGKEVTSGTFMEMAASDGPHYGNNIKLDPGTYDLTITIHSPGENGYLIHSDSETGPGGSLKKHFEKGNLSYKFEGWEFAGLE